MVYETKGLSLEECDRMMREVYPWQSRGWREGVVERGAEKEEEVMVQGTGVAAAMPAPEPATEVEVEAAKKGRWWSRS